MAFFRRHQYDSDRSSRQYSQERGNGGTYLIDEKSASPMAIIYRSELDYISRCVLDYPNIETGGQLFGFWTSQGAPVVLYAIGPGHNANHQPTFFNQDVDYLQTVGNELLRLYSLQHIGEWHSHHTLGLARPSGHDAQTMFHGLQNIPQRRLLLCICNYENGKSVINPYTFHENDMRNYVDAAWLVNEMESPFRGIADKALESILIHPRTTTPRHGNNRIINPAPQAEKRSSLPFEEGYWLLKLGNIDEMKRMVAFLSKHFPGKKIDIQADEEKHAQINIDDGELIFRFPQNFPDESPLVFKEGLLSPVPVWLSPDGDTSISEQFKIWCSLFLEVPIADELYNSPIYQPEEPQTAEVVDNQGPVQSSDCDEAPVQETESSSVEGNDNSDDEESDITNNQIPNVL